MKEITLKQDGTKLRDQLQKLGYTIHEKGIPKYFVQKDEIMYAVLVSPKYLEGNLLPDQERTKKLLENSNIEVLIIYIE